MISTIKKIEQKADEIRLRASLGYKGKDDRVPYKEDIVKSDKFPNFYFLVTENMVFKGNSLKDACYEVYSFNAEGDFLRKENVDELGKGFFSKMNVIKNIK